MVLAASGPQPSTTTLAAITSPVVMGFQPARRASRINRLSLVADPQVNAIEEAAGMVVR